MTTDSPERTTGGLLGKLRRAWLTIATARRHSGLRGMIRATAEMTRAAWHALLQAAGDVVVDVRLRVRTRGIVHNEATLQGASSIGDSQPYEPVHRAWWRQVMAALPLAPAHTTFVDLGAGRGRALLLAAEAGFRRVIGIEIDPDLAAEAEANINRWMGRRRQARRRPDELRVILGDAADHPLPSGDVLICLYNPFGAETLHRVLTRVCAGRSPEQDRAAIAYFNPVHDDVFQQFPDLVVHARGSNWTLYNLDNAVRLEHDEPRGAGDHSAMDGS